MAELLDRADPSGQELDLSVRRYFEVISCDEMDLFIYLLGFSKRFIQRMSVEGEENLREASRSRGGIFLSAHFGGGFWILPFLKNRGVPAHFFSADIEKKNYPPFKKALYLYHRLRMRAVEKASGGRVLYKKEGKKGLVEALRQGRWVILLFDVPPFLVRENMEVPFLRRRGWFPKGIVSIARETNSPLLPFFSFLDEGKTRRICFEKPFYVKDEGEGVERCVRLIEKRIIERPDHWHFWPIADQFFSPPRF